MTRTYIFLGAYIYVRSGHCMYAIAILMNVCGCSVICPKIIISSGGRTPFVIRSKNVPQASATVQTTSELIGEAYVNGVMDREDLFGA
jgi:hypothetical protein